jgi:hypothetical protein
MLTMRTAREGFLAVSEDDGMSGTHVPIPSKR